MVFHILSTAATQEKANRDKPKRITFFVISGISVFYILSFKKIHFLIDFSFLCRSALNSHMPCSPRAIPTPFPPVLASHCLFRASNKFICEGQGVPLLVLFTGFSLPELLQMWLLQYKKKEPLLYQVYPNTQTQIWEVEVMAPSENIRKYFLLGLQSTAQFFTPLQETGT